MVDFRIQCSMILLCMIHVAGAHSGCTSAFISPWRLPAQHWQIPVVNKMPSTPKGVKMLAKDTSKGKGFGTQSTPAPVSKAKTAPKANSAAKAAPRTSSTAPAQNAMEVNPALLALIAETPQRRAAREMSLASRAQELKAALETETYTVIDSLLGESMCAAMRSEALGLLGDTAMTKDIICTDTRAASVIIEPELFMQAPLCTEYVLDCAKTFGPLLSGRFGCLSSDASANMLACYGVDGGNFPVHIDNHGGGDRRVLTLIYYMNPSYDAKRQGGCFVPYKITDKAPPKGEPPVMLSPDHLMPLEPVEPIADRLIAFWTCELPHSVQPFKAQKGKVDGRYAITVWLTAEEGSNVFAQGRHILSPTKAHDARAVQERDR
jgi:hypothetical protein